MGFKPRGRFDESQANQFETPKKKRAFANRYYKSKRARANAEISVKPVDRAVDAGGLQAMGFKPRGYFDEYEEFSRTIKARMLSLKNLANSRDVTPDLWSEVDDLEELVEVMATETVNLGIFMDNCEKILEDLPKI